MFFASSSRTHPTIRPHRRNSPINQYTLPEMPSLPEALLKANAIRSREVDAFSSTVTELHRR